MPIHSPHDATIVLESPLPHQAKIVRPRIRIDPLAADWHWQLRHAFRDIGTLLHFLPDGVILPEISGADDGFPMAVTPYYASLIRRPDYSDPVFAQCVPQPIESRSPPWLCDDPLNEERDSPLPGLIHRYPDRVLLLATSRCAVHCRHCMRKRVAGRPVQSGLGASALRACVGYLHGHPEVKEVLISGGDPLTLSNLQLERILKAVRSVSSVQVIRLATRAPVTLPMRIDAELAGLLRHYGPVYVNTHFNHPVEITAQAAEALAFLADAGLPLGNQTVLLRGVNDRAETIETLCRELLRHRVRPYYLFQCDLVHGIEHFRTPLQTGLDIMGRLRGRLSGLAIPHFAVDTPNGGGKVELLPEMIVSRHGGQTVLRNPAGEEFAYPDPIF